MSTINIEEAVQKFRSRVESDYFPKIRSKNTAPNYSEKSEPRDTKAVKDFVGTGYFEYIKNME